MFTNLFKRAATRVEQDFVPTKVSEEPFKERQKFPRPLPAPEVIEGDDDVNSALWSEAAKKHGGDSSVPKIDVGAARTELRQSEDRYRTLVEWTPDPLFVHRDGKFIYANPAAIRMFGAASEDKLLGTAILDRIHPDYRQIVLARVKHFLEHGGTAPMIEEKMLKVDGTVIDVEGQGTIISYDGKPAVQVVMHDITKRKQAEAALLQEKALLRGLIDSMSDLIFIKDANGVYIDCNKASEQLIGIPRSEQIGKTDFDFFDKQTAEIIRGFDRKVINEGVLNRSEEWVSHPDGARILLETCKTPLYGPSGKVEGLVGICRDITQRKQTEVKLNLAASVFDFAREGIAVTDIDGTIIDVNESFTRITGYAHEEAIGRNPRILKSGRQNQEFYVAMWRDLRATDYWSGELWNKRKDGQIYPESLTITAVRDDGGYVVHYVALFSDITSRRQTEDQVHQMAFFDSLTKLPNRWLLNNRLGQAMAVNKRSACYGALMFLDLDNFKPLNDAHGHAAGDSLLIEVASRLLRCVREVDTVARVGGDEFVVMLNELVADRTESASQAQLIAEKIRSSLSEPYLLTLKKQVKAESRVEHRCTASIGVALFANQEASQDDVLKWADKAMYQAKAAGRNIVKLYEEDLILNDSNGRNCETTTSLRD
jgi:diguanylate cyclase (GGDEF)-like protein/PAS domain S-box-containing protein